MAEVFISYARANEDVAKRVANGLKAAGHDAWWDEQLPAHRAYTDIIEQRLRSASAVVVLWSKDAAQSQWVRAEADFARNERKLVQALLDDTLPPLPFNQIQCADLKGWRGNRKHRGWTKLVDSVSAVTSGAPLEEAEPTTARTRRGIDRRTAMAAIGVLLLLLVVAAVMLAPRMFGPADDAPPRVAVLPFKSVGGSDEGLVAGIWEDTRHALARNPQLVVLGPNTSEELAGKGSDAIRKAADYLVEASVRTAANRIRVTTSLVRSKDSAEIWSQTFDRKLDDVFALQSEIAQQIEGRIRGRLARGGGIKPENIATTGEVYALYSAARATIRGRDVTRYDEALKQLEQVIAKDPNFAPGWATLSVAATFGIGQLDPKNAAEREAREKAAPHPAVHINRAEEYARRAIALAPNLAAGHAALGFALGARAPEAKAALKRAVALDPSDVEALNWLAAGYDKPGEEKERLKLYSRIVEIEPLWWPAILNKLSILLEQDNFAAAEQERARLEKLGSTLLAGMVGISIADAKGDFSEAARIGISTFNAVPPNERGILGYELGFLLLKLGYFDEVQNNFDVPAPAPYLWRNDPRGLDILEAEQLTPEQFFTMGPLSQSASRVYLLSGRGARLAELFRKGPGSAEGLEEVAGLGELVVLGPSIALALRQTGEPAEADRLLSVANMAVARLYKPAKPTRALAAEQNAVTARIYAVQGHKSEALDHLSLAVQSGWVPDPPSLPTDIALDPPLALLKGDPRFESSRQKILDRIGIERAELGPVHLNSGLPNDAQKLAVKPAKK